MPLPDFLVIGHVTLDLTEEGAVPGGTAFYSSLTAARLGRRVALLTRGAPPQARGSLATLAQVVDIPSSVTTTFENCYADGVRTQVIHSVAPPIEVSHLPDEWRGCPVALLAPVFDEMDSTLAACFPKALLGVSPQGWLRRSGPSGIVEPKAWSDAETLGRAEVLVLSEMDLPEKRVPPNWLTDDRVVILTQGPRGALMHYGDRWFRIPPYPAKEADLTGAGDVFAAAYLVRYSETGDPLTAGMFASCAASFKVENKGSKGVPTRDQITHRMDQFQELKVTPCENPSSPYHQSL